MRQKRAKAYKKQMATYERTFSFRTPYQVLITSDFLTAARSFHLDPIAGLKRTLQGDIKCMMSQCSIKVLYDADDQTEIRLAKTLERRRCGHVEAPETAASCVAECVGPRNKNRYIVATQDVELRKRLRDVPGVPLIYINRSIMILEPPSPATLTIKGERERGQIGLSAEEAVILGKRKRGVEKKSEAGPGSMAGETQSRDEASVTTPGEQDSASKKKRRGVSGPNPLSALRSKKKSATVDSTSKKVRGEIFQSIITNATKPSEPQEGKTQSRRRRKHKGKSGTTGVDSTAAESISIATAE